MYANVHEFVKKPNTIADQINLRRIIRVADLTATVEKFTTGTLKNKKSFCSNLLQKHNFLNQQTQQ